MKHRRGFIKRFWFLLFLLPVFPSPRSLQPRSWRLAERKESERQADRTRDICPRQQTDGGRKPEVQREKRFSFSPFHFPLADSKKLMTEQEDNLLLCFSAVLLGLGRDGRAAESCQPLTLSHDSLSFLSDI